MLQQALSLPERLIERRLDRRGVTMEAITVLFLGLLGSAGLGYLAFEAWTTAEEFVKPAYTHFALAGMVAKPVGLLLLSWLGYSVISHFLANMWGGRGPIVRLLRVSAWSLVPVGIWMLLRSIVIGYLVFTTELESDPTIEEIGPTAFVNYYSGEVLEDPIYVVAMLVGLLFVGWSWRLLSVGVSEAKNIPLERARRIAAVPAGILGLRVLQLALQWQGIL